MIGSVLSYDVAPGIIILNWLKKEEDAEKLEKIMIAVMPNGKNIKGHTATNRLVYRFQIINDSNESIEDDFLKAGFVLLS